jgi:hypothetical protein
MELQLFDFFDFFRKKQRFNQRYRSYDQTILRILSGFDYSDCRNFDVENVLFYGSKKIGTLNFELCGLKPREIRNLEYFGFSSRSKCL